MGVKDSLLERLLGNTGSYTQKQVDQTINLILEHGLTRSASAIHIEPHGTMVWVRYRIHGALHGLHKLPLGALAAIMKALKQHAGLMVSVPMPQEGHFEWQTNNETLTIRVNTMTVVGGERAVLHFAHAVVPAPATLESLGFWGANLGSIQLTLARPHGLVLVSGPKHANRPATLYALLHLLRTSAMSIAAIEETASPRLHGITQTRLGAPSPAAYAEAFQAALHQDMNAIMIEHLPDKKVAEEVVHAATTGHFIAAGSHSPTAARALLHLKHSGVEPFMLAAALRLAIAQHTVRRLCPECRERIVPASAQLARLEKIFGMTSPANRKRVHALEKLAEKSGIGAGLPLSSTPSRLTHIWRPGSHGCEHCHFTGYSGTITLNEVLSGGDYLYRVLNDDASVASLQAAALKEGFIPITLDGIIKALRGETTITEVMHAVGTA